MAKKDKFNLDDFGFEKELNFPDDDFDFDIQPPKDDRKPVTKVATGALAGAKDRVFSNEFVKKFIKTTLPRGYGEAVDAVGQGVGEARKLYNTTAKEIKPTINELKKTTKRAIPLVQDKLPDGLLKRIKSWSDTAQDGSSFSGQDFRESNISAQLGEIFKERAEQESKDRAEAKVKTAISDSLAQKRHGDIFAQLDEIRISTDRLAAYQDKVTVNYHRKSLELQFRHYYIASDMLEEQKKANEIFKSNLADIVKNTALPEFVKLQNRERMGELMRSKLLGNIYDSVFDRRSGYVGKAINRLGTRIKDKVTGFANDVSMGLSAIDSGIEGAEMAKEMGGGVDPYSIAGNIAGSEIADSLGTKAGKKIGSWINKSKYGRQVRTLGNDLEYGTRNLSQMGDKFARGEFDYDDGIMGKLISKLEKIPGGSTILDALKDAASTGSTDYGFKTDSIKDMQGVATFTNQTRKSITEVIPGFLARIYQELQIIRTGDSSVGLTEYDYNSNKFSSSKELFASTMSKIINKDQVDSFERDNDSLINKIDPEGKLNKKQRQELGKFFLSDNFKNGLGDPKRFTDASQFRGVSAETAKQAAALFSSTFGIDEFGEVEDKEKFSQQRNEFSKAYSGLGNRFGDSRQLIQQIIALGQQDLIRQSGLMNEKGEFSPDQLYRYLAGESYEKSGPKSKPAPVNKFGSVAPTGGQAPRFEDHAANNGFDTTAFAKDSIDIQKQILDAINNANSKQFDQTTAETTTRIEKLVEQILESREHSIDDGSSQSSGKKRKKGKKGSKNNQWYNMSIGDVLGAGLSTLGSGISYAKDQIKKGAQGAAALGQSVVGGVFGLGKKAADFMIKRRDEFVDIYVKGEALPKLQAWRMKAGQYFDQKTGKVITKLEDIKSAVVDKDGNIVLSLEDMKNIIPPDGRSYLSKAFRGIINLGKSAFFRTTNLPVQIFNMAKTATKFLRSGLMKMLAKDVYVIGEENPRLLAITMKVGGYRSKLTGKTIWKPTQIDGPVVNTDGDVILSDDDLRKGIVDKDGNKIQSLISKALSLGKNFLVGATKAVNKGVKWAAKTGRQLVDTGLDVMRHGLFGEKPNKDSVKNTNTVVKRLTEIRDLLKARLPENKKVLGDSDGDGDRDNSWQDMAQRREKAAKEAKAAKATAGGAAGAKAAGKDKGKEKEDDDDDGMDLSDVSAGLDMAKGAWGKAKSWGKKGLKFLKKIPGARFLGKGLGLAGAAYGAYSAFDNVSKGNYGAAALDAGLAAGSTALTLGGTSALAGAGATALGMGSSALGLMGSGLAAGAGILGGLLSSPVVLGAAAIGAAGYGAYKAYQFFTRKKLEPLSTYRFAQYGFTAKDTDALQKVFGLEDRLEKSVTYERGVAKLKDDVPVEELLKIFEISPDSKQMVSAWTGWFQQRFKPVYLTHMTALKGIAPSVSLADVDSKLKPEEKQKYFDAIRFANGPYSVLFSPIKEIKSLTVTFRDVEAAAKVCEESIKKEVGKKGGSEVGIEAGKSAVALGAALATTPAVNDPTKPGSTLTEDDKLPSYGDNIKDVARYEIKKRLDTNVLNETGMGFTMEPEVINTEKQITPLNAIRYRAYGLYELEIPKINNLLTLEQVVLEDMDFKQNNVVWNGTIDKVIARVGSKFSVISYDSRAGENFSMWFNARFLPVFSNYVNYVYSFTGKKNIREAARMLSASQLLAVANSVYSAKTTFNGRQDVPVWTVTVSPWADYVVNTNDATVGESLKALTNNAKDDVANEKVPVQKPSALTQLVNDPDKSQAAAEKNIGLWDKTKNMASSASSWISDKASKAWEATKAVGSGIADSVSSAASKAKEYVSKAADAVGTTVSTVAAGIGGMLDKVPMPTAGGSWNALKDTITAASKMVGVDDKLMGIMAAIESGFNYAVKAGTSSAKGLYQFIDSTWQYMVKNYGSKYGIDANTPATDPRANALMGAEFLKMNMEKLAPTLGRAPTYTDMYLAHFMGDGGAKKFLQAMKQNPNAVASEIFPKEAAANKSIFFNKDGSPRTLQDIYSYFTGMISQKAKSFKIDVGNDAPQAANDAKANAPAGAPPQGTGVAPGVDPKADNAVAAATAPGAAPASAPTGSKTAEKIAADSRSQQPTPSTSNSTGPGAPGTASPMQTSYNASPSRDIAPQVQASKEEFNKSIGTIDKSMTELVEIQRASKVVLESILQVLQNNGAVKMPNAAQPQPQPGFTQTGAKEEAKPAPVPMRRQA